MRTFVTQQVRRSKHGAAGTPFVGMSPNARRMPDVSTAAFDPSETDQPLREVQGTTQHYVERKRRNLIFTEPPAHHNQGARDR